jgi:TetR/AcrR family transcriptional regulator, mexJK operon transcriptional repressor
VSPTATPRRTPAITEARADREHQSLRPSSRRGGRPSRLAAIELRERILSVATDLFLTQGYGLTTIEAVARRAGISKRTFYHRFEDKTALFAAVMHRIVEQMRPPPDVPLLEGATLHEVLQRLARLILHAALSPPAIAMHRLIIAESARFPELVSTVSEQGGTQEATALISGLLAREFDKAALPPEAREFAAEQFLQMVVGLPQRRAMGFGSPLTAPEIDAWVTHVVSLFLRGCRGWSAPASP